METAFFAFTFHGKNLGPDEPISRKAMETSIPAGPRFDDACSPDEPISRKAMETRCGKSGDSGDNCVRTNQLAERQWRLSG